ncbi:hypothetical protein PPERSA_03036 [Pseudocohnilembus persalinus]|uniref:Uncharacterized protein n=1 Tax=Pseudocohnilembus persalinus TaxID=266149 RepID=A0A0V0QF55_PSEPJ|nr:hypothetical protein PPERSA_03036 [Pseudocohnilembus persalinus]|eukprot:KRX00776.1 hypothetical protein PPERSA_03036 [Pseudocohnilembus persalinus]
MDESFTEQNLPQILISKQFLSTEKPDETLTINRNYEIQKFKDQNKKTQADSENLTSSTLNSPLQNQKLNEQKQEDKNQESINQKQNKNQGFQGFKKCKKGTQNSNNHQTCETQILCENQESRDNTTFFKQKIGQENGSKKQKQTLNTSHVPINMMNNLVTHLIKIYTSQIKCKCIKFSNESQSKQQPLVKEEEKQDQCINKNNTQIEVDTNEIKINNDNFESEKQQSIDLLSQKNINQNTDKVDNNNKFNNNNDNVNICRRCKELQIISSMKKSKIKNIRSFQKLWQNMRIRVLSENYLTSFATYQILNKKYRSANNRKALYECLTAFLSGTRNPDKFWKLI